jgi:ATP-dependent DNA helicase RecQ
VESLNNSDQRRIVADDREQAKVLVLAGPGSGKTRVLVHRIAYLVRARREDPRGILALAYNRHAAADIRRRLANLIGDDAKGVLVLTCHALAMSLVGASFTGRANDLDDTEFKKILKEAVSLLRGEGLPPEEVDEQRTRLLAGFRWILVDEYQDIGPDEYALISALAGRTLSEEDDKLSLFAVGDDDQNIYAFSGASVEFIRRFEEDYKARSFYLTDNYRSTAHIIDAANAVIAPARQRMKTEHPIHIDRARRKDRDGGLWTELDPVAQGKVQILPVGDTPITQAQAVIAELRRLSGLTPDWNWSSCAVVAREWSYLDPVRTLCELGGIPVQMANEESSVVWHLRETQALVNWLRGRESRLVQSADFIDWLRRQPASPWIELLEEALAAYELETGGAETAVDQFIEWLAEWGRDLRRRQRGLLLLTAHRAKGLEFDHVVVLDGGWDRFSRGEDADAPRRLYYVAMSRARQTLTLARLPGKHPYQKALQANPSVLQRQAPVKLPPAAPELARRYRQLGLSDVFLSFAGYRHPRNPLHRAIAALSPGDPLHVRVGGKRWELLDHRGMVVGQLAGNFKAPSGTRCTSAKVLAIATWSREYSEPQYQNNLSCDKWEVVVPELVFEPDS